MTPHHEGQGVTLWHGDCLDVLASLPDASVDAVVTDPPYGLEFMGKDWDSFGPQRDARTAGRVGEGAQTNGVGFGDGTFKDFKVPAFGSSKPSTWRCDRCNKRDQFRNHSPSVPNCDGQWLKEPIYEGAPRQLLAFQQWCEQWAAQCLRVLKPGGHLLAFGGSRTHHRLTSGVEDAGFEIRDCITWHHAQGFPKSLNPYRSIMSACPSSALAPHAVKISRSTRVPSAEGKAPTALALALIQPGDEPVLLTETGAEDGTNVRTATSVSALAAHMSLSTESLWSDLWAAVSDPTNMSTISTTSRMTTVLRTLSSSQLPNMPASTTSAETLPDGCVCPAFTAGHGLNGDVPRSSVIPVLTAPVSATGEPLQSLSERGTALRPATEFIVVARKPLAGTVAANVQAWGTGALNIDATRIASADDTARKPAAVGDTAAPFGRGMDMGGNGSPLGRWPANVIFDDTQAARLDEQSGERPSQKNRTDPEKGTAETESHLGGLNAVRAGEYLGETGGASRFFFVAKADASERPRIDGTSHATVKPLALMRHLVRLVTPPGGTVLEPFAGSGTTVEACLLEGFRCIAIEKTDEYLPLVLARIHRQRDPVQAIKLAGEPLGLFDLDGLGA